MGKYWIHDARRLTKVIDKKVDLIISSPPYFDMKDYGAENQIGWGQKYSRYLEDMGVVLSQCHQVTKATGSMWLIVDTLKKNGDLVMLPDDITGLAKQVGWKLQEIIIWKKDRTLPYSRKGEMRNIFEYILFFVKSDRFKYYPKRVTTLDPKGWWVKYPERYSSHGKAPTDIWEFPIPVQGSWGSSYIRHFCPLPRGLTQRIIDLCTNKGDVVFDPFAGSGAVLSEAFVMGREYLGCDLNPHFKEMFEEYLEGLKPNTANDSSARKMFASTIGKLRLLKLPSAILKKLNKDHPHTFAKIDGVHIDPIGNRPGKKNKLWSAKYTFVGLTENSDDALVVQSLFQRAPFSKYGIEPTLEFVNQTRNTMKYEYEWPTTHKREARFGGLKKPFIASNFRLTRGERSLVEKST